MDVDYKTLYEFQLEMINEYIKLIQILENRLNKYKNSIDYLSAVFNQVKEENESKAIIPSIPC